MFCNKCGAEIVGAGRFCVKCGAMVTATVTTGDTAPVNQASPETAVQTPNQASPEPAAQTPNQISPEPVVQTPVYQAPVYPNYANQGQTNAGTMYNQPVTKQKSTFVKLLPILIPVPIIIIGAVIFLILFFGKEEEEETSRKKKKTATTTSTTVSSSYDVSDEDIFDGSSETAETFSFDYWEYLAGEYEISDSWWVCEEDIINLRAPGVPYTVESLRNSGYAALCFSHSGNYFEYEVGYSGAHYGYDESRIVANDTIGVTLTEGGDRIDFFFEYYNNDVSIVFDGLRYIRLTESTDKDAFLARLTEVVNEGIPDTVPDGLAKDFVNSSGYFAASMWLCQDELIAYYYGTTPDEKHTILSDGYGYIVECTNPGVETPWYITNITITSPDTLEMETYTYGDDPNDRFYTTFEMSFAWEGDRIYMTCCAGDYCMRYAFVSPDDDALVNYVYY